jgi:hypothetical protein
MCETFTKARDTVDTSHVGIVKRHLNHTSTTLDPACRIEDEVVCGFSANNLSTDTVVCESVEDLQASINTSFSTRSDQWSDLLPLDVSKQNMTWATRKEGPTDADLPEEQGSQAISCSCHEAQEHQ